ncbi:hypothetical protein OAU93_01640 [bacterium]|nr:hypothetical protein [bacterium]
MLDAPTLDRTTYKKNWLSSPLARYSVTNASGQQLSKIFKNLLDAVFNQDEN